MTKAMLYYHLAAVPQPKAQKPQGLGGKIDQMLGLAMWAGTAAGVLGILITGAMMGISLKRGESSEHMSRLGMVLGGCCLVATAGPFATWVF
ncbi:hypothetical protein [Streptomyces axinellae]|jgi:hypothetical protein|uniref:Integral membrane protein n=1 Tax=Streptomyces axinellae TaxID=552788 RepID=A0ABN3PYW4_9ACTN